MAVEVKYRQAVKFFLHHLQENNMTQRWLESFRQTLQGSFKRFIGSELKLYPLSLDKVRDRYSKPRQYSFACSVKKFHFFIKTNPHLLNAHFGHAIAELIEHLSELSTHTKRYIKNNLFKIISFDVDELAVSQIPEKVIRDCMKESYRHMLVRGKRFFKFLIHANMLNSKYLPVYTSKMMKFVEQKDDSEGDQVNLEQSSTSLKSDCS